MKTIAFNAEMGAARRLIPGLLVTSLVAMSAAFLGSHYKGSMLLFALLLGLRLTIEHVVTLGWQTVAALLCAIAMTMGLGLLLAIAGVGLKTSLQDVTQLGWRPVLMIILVTLGLAGMAAAYLA
jgi:uncharacterized membrane protein YadS